MIRLVVTLLLLSGAANAQLHVSSNSYVYVRDQLLYVNQDIDLQNNSNIYLRSESQLLQGTTGTSLNKGLGKLSVFQEGTSDNFDYNYWCSPIGNASALAGNENFGITMLGVPTSTTISSNATVLPSGSLNGTASPLAIASAWIYKYVNLNSYSQWIAIGGATAIGPGEGFTMKGTSGTDATVVDGVQNNSGSAQRYDFRGKPNDGTIAVAVGTGNQTLTGNPYPSALHVNAFLLDASNLACDGIAYYWEQNKATNSHFLAQYQGGYGTYSPVSVASNGIYVPATFNTYDGNGNLNTVGTSSGLSIERKYAPIGQGFMVKGIANGSVLLKNTHRAYYKESGSLSQFEKHSASNLAAIEDVSCIRLNAIMNNQFTKQLALALIESSTDGPDRGIDAKDPSEESLPNNIWFDLDNAKYVIQGVQFNSAKRIKLGVKAANNTSIRFYIPETVNFDPSQEIFIFDAADNSYHNIRTGFFDITLDQGEYLGRFELTFTDASLNVGDNHTDEILIVQNNENAELTISNPKLAEISGVTIFDLTGKLIIDTKIKDLSSLHNVSTASLADGVYLVRVTGEGRDVVSQKISVMNRR